MKKGYLYLSDGSYYEGNLYGEEKIKYGELVFNTSMTGYQEILTDPSYAKQIVILTYPFIGNYGINDIYSESQNIFASGLVVKNLENTPSNFMSKNSLEEFANYKNLTILSDIDTRALTIKIRDKGVMNSIISPKKLEENELKELFSKPLNIESSMTEVGVKEIIEIKGNKETIGVLDLGVKNNIIENLKKRDVNIKIFPYGTVAEDILAHKIDGLLVSNGPGDPKYATKAIECVKKLFGKLPIFGICMGNQVISLAAGGDTYKMKFGHRGGNHGVIDYKNNRSFITSQNHGYAVDEKSLENSGFEVAFRNLNDDTVEGIRHKDYPIFSVQFHPEACPGPRDTEYLFDEFLKLVRGE